MEYFRGIHLYTIMLVGAAAIILVGPFILVLLAKWYREQEVRNCRTFNSRAYPIALHGKTGKFLLELGRWVLCPHEFKQLLKLRWRRKSLAPRFPLKKM